MQAPERRRMKNTFIYTPKINHEVKEVITIADLIPEGRENAISSEVLIEKCLESGLIAKSEKDKAMAILIRKAKMDWTILKRSDTGTYYRLTHEESLELRRYIRQEKNGVEAVFHDKENAKKLYEDLKAGRLED